MPLADFMAQRKVVEFPGGSFSVRAITLMDMSRLIYTHQQEIDHIVSVVRARQDLNLDSMDVITGMLLEVIHECPFMIADLIAMCADEPDMIENAMKLPITTQLEAVLSVGELTFTDLASVKKFAADAKNLVLRILPPKEEAAAA